MAIKELDIRVCKIDKDDLKTQDMVHLTEHRKGDEWIGGFHQIESKDAYFVVALRREYLTNDK